MKEKITTTKYTRIELSRQDIRNFLTYMSRPVPDDVIIRFYDAHGEYWDISEEYPIVVSFSKEESK